MLVSTLWGILATLLFFLKGMYYEKMSGVLGFLRIQPKSSGDSPPLCSIPREVITGIRLSRSWMNLSGEWSHAGI